VPSPTLELIRELAGERETLKTAEIRAAGISGQSVTRLVRAGQLERVQRGLYRLPDSPITEHHDLVNVIKVAPKAIIVLISALRFHEIGTQVAREVWIQLPLKAHAPRIAWPPIKIVRTSIGALLTEGVEIHRISGENIPITCPARTVADCFKHRSQIGLESCLEALREVLSSKRGIVSEIHHYAKLNRVAKVMQPYLEGMV
jgi:predicted transcriptional regulator of viral defense system